MGSQSRHGTGSRSHPITRKAGRVSMQIVFDIAARRAELTPDKPAFVDLPTGTVTTYATLHERAGRFAAWLQARGIKAGDRVAILSPNAVPFLEKIGRA